MGADMKNHRATASTFHASMLVATTFSITGCGQAAFSDASTGYDQQGCIENALRRAPSKGLLPASAARFRDACGGGEAASCSALGVMHELGLGMPADPARAAALYDEACVAGNARGCVNLGAALSRGAGVARDDVRARKLFSSACQGGEVSGCAQLGRLIVASGTELDARYARELLDQACNAAETSACVALAELHVGAGRSRDALVAYTKACMSGEQLACKHMDAPVVATSSDAVAGWRGTR